MDNEIKGTGNSLNFKYRMHDSRIGRFFAVDPLAKKFPHNSPYAFSENVLIDHVELEGLEKEWYVTSSVGRIMDEEDYILELHKEGMERLNTLTSDAIVVGGGILTIQFHGGSLFTGVCGTYSTVAGGTNLISNLSFNTNNRYDSNPISMSANTLGIESKTSELLGLGYNITTLNPTNAYDQISTLYSTVYFSIDELERSGKQEEKVNSVYSLDDDEFEFVQPSIVPTKVDETSTLGQGTLQRQDIEYDIEYDNDENKKDQR